MDEHLQGRLREAVRDVEDVSSRPFNHAYQRAYDRLIDLLYEAVGPNFEGTDLEDLSNSQLMLAADKLLLDAEEADSRLANGDRLVMACNYVEATKAIPEGAKAYVTLTNPGDGRPPERIEVLARSRGGRWIRKWESTQRLGDFRAVVLPPEHPRFPDERILPADEEFLEAMEGR